MAVYQYECRTCGNQYEVNHPIKDDSLTEHECVHCESMQPCFKVITCSNFVLLGDGWERDGYTSNKEKLNQIGDLM